MPQIAHDNVLTPTCTFQWPDISDSITYCDKYIIQFCINLKLKEP